MVFLAWIEMWLAVQDCKLACEQLSQPSRIQNVGDDLVHFNQPLEMEIQQASVVERILSHSRYLIMDGVFQIGVLHAERTKALLVNKVMPLDKRIIIITLPFLFARSRFVIGAFATS